MKRSTRWTTAIAAAALIGLPAAGFAQTSASPQPPKTDPAAQAPQATATSPADHVREAKQAFESIPQTSVPAADRAKFAQLRRNLNALERDIASAPSAPSAKATPAKAKSSSWSTDVAAIDKLLTDLIGPETGAPATGETAAPPAQPTAGTSGRSGNAARATALDDLAKDKLREVRRHITELAAAMSGTPKTEDQAAGVNTSASNPDTMGSASSAAAAQSAAGSPTMSSTQPTGSAAPQSAGAAAQAGQTAPTQTDTAAAAQQPQVDAAAAKQHLSEARESLSQLTALPEATRLQGEARTKVSELISNFNELITTQSDWKAAYGKVTADLNALLGPEGSDESAAPTATSSSASGAVGTTGAAGAPAAAGTSGQNMQIEPAIKAKLQDVRTHLKAFALAAGGAPGAENAAPSAAPSSMTNPSNPASANPASPANPTSANPSTPPTSAPPTSTPPAAPPSNPSMTGAAASSSAAAAEPQAAAASAAAGHAEADRHLDAINEILTKASKDGKASLDKAELDQLKMHLDQLRQLLKQGEGKDK